MVKRGEVVFFGRSMKIFSSNLRNRILDHRDFDELRQFYRPDGRSQVWLRHRSRAIRTAASVEESEEKATPTVEHRHSFYVHFLGK